MRVITGFLLLWFTAAAHAGTYGAPITESWRLTLDQAVSLLGNQDAVDVVIVGEVATVCHAKGCWLGMKSATRDVHVTFQNGSFFVPPTLIGKTVVVRGLLTKAATTQEQTNTLGQTNTPEQAKPRVRYALVASGIAEVEPPASPPAGR